MSHLSLPKPSTQPGFTLIEMLVAIGIGLLMITIGVAGYIDFNARQKVLGAAREMETVLQAAQTKTRSGDLAGCSQLGSYQVTFDLVTDPVKLTLTPLCQDGSTGTLKTYFLTTGVTLALSPAIDSLSFPIINGGIIFSPSTSEVTFTLGTDAISQTYQLILARGGDLSEGVWQ